MADKIIKNEKFNCPDCNATCIATKIQSDIPHEEAIFFGGAKTEKGLRIDLYHPDPQCPTFKESAKTPEHIPSFMMLAVTKRNEVLLAAKKVGDA